jgi:hypothetical protein
MSDGRRLLAGHAAPSVPVRPAESAVAAQRRLLDQTPTVVLAAAGKRETRVARPPADALVISVRDRVSVSEMTRDRLAHEGPKFLVVQRHVLCPFPIRRN